MQPDTEFVDLQALISRVQRLIDANAQGSPELADALDSLSWRLKRLTPGEARAEYGVGAGANVSPEVIDAATKVAVFVGGALVNNWVARADNRVTQAILRRRKNRRAPTAAQVQEFARSKINLEWPGTVSRGLDAYSEARGPDGWSVAWVLGKERFTVEGDNDLKAVRVTRTRLG